jgi:hypothetical protein
MHLVEMIFTISVPLNSAFTPKTQVFYRFTLRRFFKRSKTIQTIIFLSNKVECMNFVQKHRYFEIVHSLPKQILLSFTI